MADRREIERTERQAQAHHLRIVADGLERGEIVLTEAEGATPGLIEVMADLLPQIVLTLRVRAGAIERATHTGPQRRREPTPPVMEKRMSLTAFSDPYLEDREP